MNLREQMERDDRFDINPITMDSLFGCRTIYKYKLKKIEIGKIRRFENKKISMLQETDTYRYLEDPESEENQMAYEEYCKQGKNLKDNPNRSQDTFMSLKDTFEEEKYDPKKGIIVINQYNCIVDGFHRSCIFLKKYGPQYQVEVLQIKCSCERRLPILSFIFELKMKFKELFRI